MKIVNYEYPHSSFLSVEKDMNVIVNKILKNDRLKKMLHYTSRDCLSKPNLTEDESLELFGKNIKLIPKLFVDGDALNYILINFDNFAANNTNPQFRDNIIVFDIVCHFDQWNLKDFELRPYKIAAEIDTMFNNKKLTGIGTLQFLGCNQQVYTSEFAGLTLMYAAVHGDEDKKGMPNPNDNLAYEANFNKIFNEKDE